MGSVQLIATADGLGDEAKHLCGIVERETARLDDLVEDMLQLSRPRKPQLAEVDIARTAREVVALAGQSGRGSDVIVRYDGPRRAKPTGSVRRRRTTASIGLESGAQRRTGEQPGGAGDGARERRPQARVPLHGRSSKCTTTGLASMPRGKHVSSTLSSRPAPAASESVSRW